MLLLDREPKRAHCYLNMLSKRYLVDSLLLTFVVCASTYAQSFKDLPNYGPWGNGPSYGLRWSLNATDPGTWIAYSSTTLQVPGPAQQANSSTGALGFYPAMTDRNGDIIQSVIATFAQTQSNASVSFRDLIWVHVRRYHRLILGGVLSGRSLHALVIPHTTVCFRTTTRRPGRLPCLETTMSRR